MKIKSTIVALGLIIAVMMLVGCREQEPQWHKFFGFTVDDVEGTYHSTPDAEFDIPATTAYVQYYDDVDVLITKLSDKSLNFRIAIPNEYVKEFSGQAGALSNEGPNNPYYIMLSASDSIWMHNLSVDVLRDDDGAVALRGEVRKSKHNPGNVESDFIVYYFMVAKN